MALFYGVYLTNLELAAGLDLIRFFSEPEYFRRSHITIRGPYEKRLSAKFELKLERLYSDAGRTLEVVGVGSFFFGREQSNQNTVILQCELDGAERVWNKPDFQDGKAHITLYDGPSRNFALALRHTLKKYSWNFRAKTTGLEALDKKQDPTEYLQIYFYRAQAICDKLFEGEVAINRFELRSELERIYLIDRVSNYLHNEIISKGRIIF